MAFWKPHERLMHYFDLLAENLRHNVDPFDHLALRYAAEGINCEKITLSSPGPAVSCDDLYAAFSDDYQHFVMGGRMYLWRWHGRAERAPAVLICAYNENYSFVSDEETFFIISGQRSYVVEAMANLRSKFGERIDTAAKQ